MTNHRCLLFAAVVISSTLLSCRTTDPGGSAVKVVNGVDVNADDPVAASTVGLTWNRRNGGPVSCSGTLISRRHVLTAGHCIDLGGIDPSLPVAINFGLTFTSATKVFISSYVVHPDYQNADHRPGVFTNADIVVMTLSQDAPAGYTPVSMLKQTDALAENDPIIVAGYGVSEYRAGDPTVGAGTAGTLRKGNQKVFMSPDPKVPSFSYLPMTNAEPSACHGDSGGPVYVQRDGHLILAGVTSNGSGSRCVNGRDNVTDIRYLNDWVQTQISANG